VTSDPQIQELLSPLNEPEDDLAWRRVQVDRERIISHMVQTSLAPEDRFGARTRIFAALALAASFALATWGGVEVWRRSSGASAAALPTLEVVALRGSVAGIQGGKSQVLAVGMATSLSAEGSLETSRAGGARIKTPDGLVIDVLENSKVTLGELRALQASTALGLERGEVRCQVPHQPGRTFSIVTALARVVDVGTIFSVSVDASGSAPNTRVSVEEGEVLVQHAGQQSRLTAAQTWSSAGPPSQAATEPAPADVAVEDLPTASARREPVVHRRETLAAETKLLQSGLASEQKGDLVTAAKAFRTLASRYPESQLAPDAKAALARVKGRLENPK
jgi:ferric-dicitrate binding protein FerR (iron transport regulator)